MLNPIAMKSMRDSLALSLAPKPDVVTLPAAPATPADEQSRAEMAEAKAAMQAVDKARDAAVAYNNDGEFFSCVVFPTKQHRDLFLAATKARAALGDGDMQYIDGMHLARQLNIELPPAPPRPKQSRLAKLFAAGGASVSAPRGSNR